MKTKVVFKKISWHGVEDPIVEVNAIFPEKTERKANGETFYLGYTHIGQHSEIHEDFLSKNEVGVLKVENASYDDYKDLALELEQIGYELEIIKAEETHLTQKQLQQEIQSLGYNIVSCGSCGDVFLHKTPSEELQCPNCDLVGDPCNFPDLF